MVALLCDQATLFRVCAVTSLATVGLCIQFVRTRFLEQYAPCPALSRGRAQAAPASFPYATPIAEEKSTTVKYVDLTFGPPCALERTLRTLHGPRRDLAGGTGPSPVCDL